ncbi:MAG: caspase family protein [Sphaerochaeta sp.]|nr:caspase family protein [Sphaerochaeta sp.]
MKKVTLFALLLSLLLFPSCELFLSEEPLGSIHAIYVALNYHGTDVNYLEGTLNDATELQQCLGSLSSNNHRPYTAYPFLQRGGALLDDSQARHIYAYDDASSEASLPTKGNVLGQIEDLIPFLSEKDLTIFSYSGHGIGGGSLVLASPSLDDPTIYDENNRLKPEVLLSVTELLSALSVLPGKQLLILDSCYCGSFVEKSGSSVSLIERSEFLDEAFTTYFSSERYSPSLFVLAATTSDNTSKERGGSTAHSHGYFTEAVLEGLGWDHGSNTVIGSSPAMKKGVLTTDSLYAYILENQDLPLTGINPKYYQHPTTSGGAYTLRLF